MYNSYNLKASNTSQISSVIVDIISDFKKYLSVQNISSGSLRSYLSDVRFFLNWFFFFLHENHLTDNFSPSDSFVYLNEGVLNSYKHYLIKVNTPLKTINRRFSSLRKFGVFCQSQKWCSLLVFDTLKNISVEEKPFPEDVYHLEEFRINLWKDHSSKATIKNYLNDVKQFLTWTEKLN